ncbi:MAG: ATP-binding protein [Actinomycetota bacterium]|nr:ATP-binding protein [Actinomycetota bacterium]
MNETGSTFDLSSLGIGRLFEFIPDGIIVAELDSETIIGFNGGAERIFGYSAEEAKGMPLASLVPERLRGAHRAGIAAFRARDSGRLIDSGEPVELSALRWDGSEITIELTLGRVTSTEASGIYAMGLVRDVSERKRLEAFRDDFIANAAHELRTPATALLGFAEVLRRWKEMPEERVGTAIEALNRQAERLRMLLASMLDISRLRRGTFEVHKGPVDLTQIVQRSLEAAPLVEKDVHLELPKCMMVTGDAVRIEQIVTNYLTNAQRYGGDTVSIEGAASEGAWVLSVIDDGPGVPRFLLENLFEPFHSGSDANTHGGSGLGLAIVRMLAGAMDGEAWHEPVEPQGARFSLRLPKDG